MGWFPFVITFFGYLAHVLRFPFFFRVGFYHPGRFIHDCGSNYRYSCCNIGVSRAGFDTSKYGIRGCFFGLDILTLNVLSIPIGVPNPNGNEGHGTLTMLGYVPVYFFLKFAFYVCGLGLYWQWWVLALVLGFYLYWSSITSCTGLFHLFKPLGGFIHTFMWLVHLELFFRW